MSDLDKYFVMLKDRVEGMGVRPATIITIGRHAMEISEKSKLKGPEKKKLVLSMLTKLINESELSDAKKTACLSLVDEGVVDSAIDLVIEVSKGNVKFNKKSLKRALKVFAPFFNCLRSVLAAPRRHPSIPVVEVEAVEVEVVEVPAAEAEAADTSNEAASADSESSSSEEKEVEES